MADEEGETGDARIEALQQYTLKTMKLKNDKWAKVNALVYCGHVVYCIATLIAADDESRRQLGNFQRVFRTWRP